MESAKYLEKKEMAKIISIGLIGYYVLSLLINFMLGIWLMICRRTVNLILNNRFYSQLAITDAC